MRRTRFGVIALVIAGCAGPANWGTGFLTSPSQRGPVQCGPMSLWETDESNQPPSVIDGDYDLSRAISARLEGRNLSGRFRAIMRMRVTAAGWVDRVCVDQSSGNREYDLAAAQAAFGVRFSPARLDGEPVRSMVSLPFSTSFMEDD